MKSEGDRDPKSSLRPSFEAPSFTALDGRITQRDVLRIRTKIIRVNSRGSRAESHAIRGNWRNWCLFSPHERNSAVTILSARSLWRGIAESREEKPNKRFLQKATKATKVGNLIWESLGYLRFLLLVFSHLREPL